MMKSIGGYFELESDSGGSEYHHTPYRMKCGRAALYFMLTIVKPSLVYVPYYTCDAMLEPFVKLNLPYRFYRLDEKLEPEALPELKKGEYFVYVDYFGIKGSTVSALAEKYRDRLIIDATQAFFAKGNGISWLFNSCRKFFGVPDGAYLYVPNGTNTPAPTERNERYITDHLLKRLEGHVSEGYAFFQKNEELMDCSPVAMSDFSGELLAGIDYDEVIRKRLENFSMLHTHFKADNLLNISEKNDEVPMCYPLLPAKATSRTALYEQNIFIPTFWGEVMSREAINFETEKSLAQRLLPLPIDHRYGPEDMARIISSLNGIGIA